MRFCDNNKFLIIFFKVFFSIILFVKYILFLNSYFIFLNSNFLRLSRIINLNNELMKILIYSFNSFSSLFNPFKSGSLKIIDICNNKLLKFVKFSDDKTFIFLNWYSNIILNIKFVICIKSKNFLFFEYSVIKSISSDIFRLYFSGKNSYPTVKIFSL